MAVTDVSQIEALNDLSHKQRMQVMLEGATAAALRLLLKGKLTMQEWEQMEQAITAIEQATPLTVAAISKLVGQSVDPAVIVNGAKRLQAAADAMLASVASLNHKA